MILQIPDFNHQITDDTNLWDKEWYNFMQELVDGVNAGGGGGTDDHTQLINIGVATHPQIDSHIEDTTIHFLKNSISHLVLQDIGVYTHLEIDSHIDSSVNPHGTTLEQARTAGDTYAGDVNYGNNAITDIKYIDFNLIASVLHQEGRLHWNGDDGTLELGMPGGNVNLQIGQENLIRATNDEGSQINNGQAVYVSGATGANPLVKLADKDSLTTASVIGVVTENITDNQKGYVTTFGYVRDMDTSGISEGAIAWLGDDGNLTGTRPTSPEIQVGVGIVMREHATEGVLFVNPYITPRLQGLSDVFITPVDGDLLKWNGSTARFEAYNLGITKEPTGFVEPKDVIITGNGDETVTLTGTVNAYYEGVKSTTIINGWTSPAHGTDTNDAYFLMYNGTTIDWVLESSGFGETIYSNLLICFAFYDPTNANWVYLRESHGLMPWQSHRENHKVNGTFRDSGGSLADYVLDSTTPADRRPSISACLLYDEDLPTENNALPTGTYTNFYLDGADGDVNFISGQADIIPLSGNRPYWNEFTGGVWQQTLMSNNFYGYEFIIAIPMAEDSPSQDLRYIHVQGQHQDNSLSNIQAVTTNDVSLGKFSSLLPEFIGITKVIYQYTAGNWKLIEVTDLTGTSSSQVSSPAGNFLTSVTSDTSLDGLGTASSPLSVSTDFFNKTIDTTDDITDTTTNRFTNDTDITRLANTSGTNTGDEDLSGLVPYTGATTDVDLGSNDIKFGDGFGAVFGDSDEASINYTAGDVLEISANADVARLTSQPSGGTDLAISTTKYANDVASGGGSAGFYKDYINGGVSSNDATFPNSIINVSAVRCRSSDDTLNIVVAQTDLDITDDADWASGSAPPSFVSDIPVLTANVDQGYTVSATNAQLQPYLAFDGNISGGFNGWVANNGTTTGFLRVSLPASKVYKAYKILSYLNTAGAGPKNWTIEGSNTGAFAGEETILDTQTNQNPLTFTEYALTNSTGYLYYQIRISSNNGAIFVGIAEISFSENSSIGSSSIHTWADYNSGTNILIFDDSTGSNIAGAKRRVGSFITDSSGDIIPFTQIEKSGGAIKVSYNAVLSSILANSSSYTEINILVPVGIVVDVRLNPIIAGNFAAATANDLYLKSLEDFEEVCSCLSQSSTGNVLPKMGTQINLTTDVNSEIQYKTVGSFSTIEIVTNGYRDERIA